MVTKCWGNKMEPPGIVPIKCALRYKPPVLILIYKDETTGKVRRRSMPLRDFSSSTDITLYVNELKKRRNKVYITAIPESQLLSLLNKVKHAQDQVATEPKNIIPSSLHDLPSLPALSRGTPLGVNTDDGEELLLRTQRTNSKSLHENFNHTLSELLKDEDTTPENKGPHGNGSLPPLDANQKYNPFSTDSLLNLKKPSLGSSPEKSSEGNVSMEIPDYSPDFNSESDMIDNLLKDGNHVSENDVSSPIEELENEGEELPEEDLNRLSEEELKKRKAEMDVLFEANKLQPGDDGYEYDKEMDFSGPRMESGWDSDHSSNVEF